jgi:hypothetical protein
VAVACVWLIFAVVYGPLTAGALSLSCALPVYNLGPISSLAPGIGLLSLLLLVMLGAALVVDRPALVSVARDRRVASLIALAAAVWLSAALAEDKATALGLAKTHLGRGVALPILVMSAFAVLDRSRAFLLARRLAVVVVAVGLAGTALAVVQVGWERGYLGRESPESSIEQFVGQRAVGLSEHPNTWAAFALIPLALCAARWLATRGRAWAISAFALTLGIVLTGARSGWIAVGAMAVYGVVGLRNVRLLVAAAVAVVGAAAIAFQFSDFRDFVAIDRAADRAQSRLSLDESADFRLALARGELELGARNPLVGVGPGNIGPALDQLDADYIEREPLLRGGAKVDKHNAYWGLFAETGALGFALFVAVLALAFASALRAVASARSPDERAIALALPVALVGTAVMGAFADIDRHVFLWWLVGLAFALDSATRTPSRG